MTLEKLKKRVEALANRVPIGDVPEAMSDAEMARRLCFLLYRGLVMQEPEYEAEAEALAAALWGDDGLARYLQLLQADVEAREHSYVF